MNIILFLIVLAVLILVHEFGHFIAAKRAGIRVDEFGLGFPPRLFGWKRGETTYTLNAIPFGGFVKIFGEDANEEILASPDKERAISAKPRLIQAWVIAAGVFFNVLFAWLLISIGFMSGLPMPVSSELGQYVKDPALTITGITEGSPAERGGLRVGDKINELSFENEIIKNPQILDVQTFIAAHEGDTIQFSITRGSGAHELYITPQAGILEDKPAIGIGMDMVGIVSLLPHHAILEGGKLTIILTGSVLSAFGTLITDAFSGSADVSSLTGPIGIVGLVGDAADFGFIYLLGFTAFISINLAIFNLIPFPALDGGRLLFLFVESITRRPINAKITNVFHATGFVLLILLLVVVSFYDLVRYGVF